MAFVKKAFDAGAAPEASLWRPGVRAMPLFPFPGSNLPLLPIFELF
jgi:hypothetical protein